MDAGVLFYYFMDKKEYIGMKRTNYCGDTNENLIGQAVVLKGWVAKRRNLGGLIFIDLWDRERIVQLVFNEK